MVMVSYQKSIESLHDLLQRVQIHCLFLHCRSQFIQSLQILQGHQTELARAGGSPGKGSPLKCERHSHSPTYGHPKIGGSGGEGTWGGLLEVDDSHSLDPNDPNLDSNEVNAIIQL
uniref:Uncharacterized protein n=1 Tax=Salix viminalis TaxID=40686 RepID=A0A6N2NHP2_SALVM